jgi:hypothetical protein
LGISAKQPLDRHVLNLDSQGSGRLPARFKHIALQPEQLAAEAAAAESSARTARDCDDECESHDLDPVERAVKDGLALVSECIQPQLIAH